MMCSRERRDPYPEFNRLKKLPRVDYDPRSFADAMVMKQVPEQYKRNCENDPIRNPALRRDELTDSGGNDG